MGFFGSFLGKLAFDEYQNNKEYKAREYYRSDNTILDLGNGDVLSIPNEKVINKFNDLFIYKKSTDSFVDLKVRIHRNVFPSEITYATPYIYSYQINGSPSEFTKDFLCFDNSNKSVWYEGKEFIKFIDTIEKRLAILRKDVKPEILKEFDITVKPFLNVLQYLKSY